MVLAPRLLVRLSLSNRGKAIQSRLVLRFPLRWQSRP